MKRLHCDIPKVYSHKINIQKSRYLYILNYGIGDC